MHCANCGQLLPATAPKFCPHCGAPVARPAAAPAPQDNKQVWITVGLFAGAWLTWGDGPSPGLVGALAWLVVLVLLVLDTLMPAWWAQFARPAWTRRPLLGSIAAGVFVVTTALVSGVSLGFILWTAATVVFLKDAWRRGELGAFDPRLLWRGWRVLLLIGIALASLTFSASWETKISVAGYTSYDYRFDGTYRIWNPGYTMGGKADAHAQGAATVPALLMLGVLVWAAYNGPNPVARWGRFLPVIVAPILIIWAWRFAVPPDWIKSNSMAAGFSAEGPGYFIFLLLPYYVGAVALALGFDRWRKTA